MKKEISVLRRSRNVLANWLILFVPLGVVAALMFVLNRRDSAFDKGFFKGTRGFWES